jgi:hypothetical protein
VSSESGTVASMSAVAKGDWHHRHGYGNTAKATGGDGACPAFCGDPRYRFALLAGRPRLAKAARAASLPRIGDWQAKCWHT